MSSALGIQVLVRKMDDSKKKHAHLKLSNPALYRELLTNDNPVLANDYDALFEKHLNDELDKTFFYLLNQKKKIEHGHITSYEADVKIGKHMADRYVQPLVQAIRDGQDVSGVSLHRIPENPSLSYEQYYNKH